MDPEACLKRAAEAIENKDWEEARDALTDYDVWRVKGGFEPEGGDERAHAMHAALPVVESKAKLRRVKK